MIEALAHDLGKASLARFGDHAGASAELQRRAGFLDEHTLNLIESHHKSSIADSNLFGDDYDAFRRFVQNCWWLELVKASTSDASNASLREHLLLADSIYQIHLTAVDRFGVDELGGKKLRSAIIELHSMGFSTDGIAYELGLPVKLLEKSFIKNASQ